MRIITRALGIAAGSCLLALFFYLVLAPRGVPSDRDSDMTATTMRRIHDSGAGRAHRLQTCPHAFVWLAVLFDCDAVPDPYQDLPIPHPDFLH